MQGTQSDAYPVAAEAVLSTFVILLNPHNTPSKRYCHFPEGGESQKLPLVPQDTQLETSSLCLSVISLPLQALWLLSLLPRSPTVALSIRT